jgi:sigma54-dependent transcription regulator
MESAASGTLFLDEIGDLPIDLQANLLRALQEKKVKPVGSTDRMSISTRVIAATNRDLDAAVRQGQFCQDLFYRLNSVQLKLPALRERKSDMPRPRFVSNREAVRDSACTAAVQTVKRSYLPRQHFWSTFCSACTRARRMESGKENPSQASSPSWCGVRRRGGNRHSIRVLDRTGPLTNLQKNHSN